MVLLVPRKSRIKSAAEVLEQDRISQTLISLPQSEAVAKVFQGELNKRGIDWPVGVEVNTLELINTYVGHWPFRQLRRNTVEGLLRLMDSNGIDRAVTASIHGMFYKNVLPANEEIAHESDIVYII